MDSVKAFEHRVWDRPTPSHVRFGIKAAPSSAAKPQDGALSISAASTRPTTKESARAQGAPSPGPAQLPRLSATDRRVSALVVKQDRPSAPASSPPPPRAQTFRDRLASKQKLTWDGAGWQLPPGARQVTRLRGERDARAGGQAGPALRP